jgi:hypothetical protein
MNGTDEKCIQEALKGKDHLPHSTVRVWIGWKDNQTVGSIKARIFL